MVKRFRFEAKLDYDQNGNGARVYAFAFDRLKDNHSGCYVHNYVWQKRCGSIAPGFSVNHKNGVTVDNRLQNLELVPSSRGFSSPNAYSSNNISNTTESSGIESTLYWKAVSQIPAINLEDVVLHQPSVTMDLNGELSMSEGDSSFFYECHYTPCCRIENQLNDFRMCGRCHEVRYCGPSCQQKDWPAHKLLCVYKVKNEKRKCERRPDR